MNGIFGAPKAASWKAHQSNQSALPATWNSLTASNVLGFFGMRIQSIRFPKMADALDHGNEQLSDSMSKLRSGFQAV